MNSQDLDIKWQLNKNNPIVDGDELFGKGFRTEDSKIAKVGDTYYMAIASGEDGNSMDIYMLRAKSLTGPWVKNQEEPIIKRGRIYNFDYKYLRVGGIVFCEGFWYLHYSGQSIFRNDSVGVAITSEKKFPFGWQKYRKNPILKPKGIGWEARGILTLCLKKIGPEGKEWYGHYTGQRIDRRYHLGVCYSKNPCGPFERKAKPILGPQTGENWDWDWRGPCRADIIKVGNKIYGAYEGSKNPVDPVFHFQIGGYFGDSLNGHFKKIFPDKPFFSGLDSGLQFANPCLWYEGGQIYLLAGRKTVVDRRPYWRYIDLFTLTLE